MIIIGNKIWRTLNQPLYVNNKKVLEVWANDTLVYPENNANFIKVRGKVIFNEEYGEEELYYPGFDSFRQPAYSGVFSGTAEFAACFACHGTFRSKFILTGLHQGEMHSGPEKISIGAYPNSPPAVLTMSTKRVTRKALGFYQTEDPGYTGAKEYNTIDKIIYRQNINAFPLIPESSWTWWSYGEPWTDYAWTARLIRQSLTEFTAFNGVHKTAEREVGSTYSTLDFERTVNGQTFRFELSYGGRNTGARLTVWYKTFTRSNGILFTDVKHRGIEVPDWTEDLNVGSVKFQYHQLFSIPVTDIMYFDNYYTAPEEMLDVTVADLDF